MILAPVDITYYQHQVWVMKHHLYISVQLIIKSHNLAGNELQCSVVLWVDSNQLSCRSKLVYLMLSWAVIVLFSFLCIEAITQTENLLRATQWASKSLGKYVCISLRYPRIHYTNAWPDR